MPDFWLLNTRKNALKTRFPGRFIQLCGQGIFAKNANLKGNFCDIKPTFCQKFGAIPNGTRAQSYPQGEKVIHRRKNHFCELEPTFHPQSAIFGFRMRTQTHFFRKSANLNPLLTPKSANLNSPFLAYQFAETLGK